MTKTNPKVDDYLSEEKKWPHEIARLRAIVLDRGLSEAFKWGKPCYTYEDSNVVILQSFKDDCALMFFKGALLGDPQGILGKPGENSQAARWVKFTDVQQIDELEPLLKAYIDEAIAVEKAGLKVEFKASDELTMPPEFQHKLDEMPELEAAYAALTPGRQRAYILHFSGAKQAKTREARVEKYIPQILAGKGLNDR